MGTNYYARENFCEHCKRWDELHIGKSSAGWCFSLHVIPEKGLNDLDNWIAFLSEHSLPIFDEYDSAVTLDELICSITKREWSKGAEKVPLGYANWENFHHQNHSKPGPNGLLRHQVDNHCISNGKGTWDCCIGEFC